jgi:hypothetical protein
MRFKIAAIIGLVAVAFVGCVMYHVVYLRLVYEVVDIGDPPGP